jgi:MinD superfamily P-loop ATPase
MVVEIDEKKCGLCGGYCQPLCVDKCSCDALRLRDKKVIVTEFLCEDCNECGCICPDEAIHIKTITF